MWLGLVLGDAADCIADLAGLVPDVPALLNSGQSVLIYAITSSGSKALLKPILAQGGDPCVAQPETGKNAVMLAVEAWTSAEVGGGRSGGGMGRGGKGRGGGGGGGVGVGGNCLPEPPRAALCSCWSRWSLSRWRGAPAL